MVSDPNVVISLVLDNTAALAAMEETEKKTDAVVSRWAIARQQIEREIRSTMRNISMLISTFRGVMSAMGQTIDPWMDALLSMTTATISMLFAIGIALTESVVGSPFAAFVFTAAVALQAFSLGRLIRSFNEINAAQAAISGRVDALVGFIRTGNQQIGGSF